MIHRVVEIGTPGNFIHQERGFLVVTKGDQELGRIPMDDISVLLLASPGSAISTALISALSDRSICTVFCGDNYHPKAWIYPYETHHLQRQRIMAQSDASVPLKKRLWQQVVCAKIDAQAECLSKRDLDQGPLTRMSLQVGSGDPENLEAQAARVYWQTLFGESFIRDPGIPGINGMLNYGYAILRAATARAIVAAGLYPCFGIHHTNQANSFVLADDLMEPFRPLVDNLVHEYWIQNSDLVSGPFKKAAAKLLVSDLVTDNGYTIVSTALQTAAQSLARSFLDKQPQLNLPHKLFP